MPEGLGAGGGGHGWQLRDLQEEVWRAEERSRRSCAVPESGRNWGDAGRRGGWGCPSSRRVGCSGPHSLGAAARLLHVIAAIFRTANPASIWGFRGGKIPILGGRLLRGGHSADTPASPPKSSSVAVLGAGGTPAGLATGCQRGHEIGVLLGWVSLGAGINMLLGSDAPQQEHRCSSQQRGDPISPVWVPPTSPPFLLSRVRPSGLEKEEGFSRKVPQMELDLLSCSPFGALTGIFPPLRHKGARQGSCPPAQRWMRTK